MKKVLALALAAVMVMALCGSALAEVTTLTDKAIVIQNTTADHNYQAYQIFTGTLSADGSKLSDIAWGNGINATGKTALFNEFSLVEGTNSITELAEAIAAAGEAGAKRVAKIVSGNLGTANAFSRISQEDGVQMTLKDGTTKTYAKDSGYYIQGLTPGYYLVIDDPTSNPIAAHEQDFYSNFIVELAGNAEATPKGSTTTVDKTVTDINESTDMAAVVDTTDTADYKVGQDIDFVLKATTASNVSDYTTYKIIFEDTLSTGLDNNGEYTISVLGQTFYLKNDGNFYESDFSTAGSGTATTSNGTVITVSYPTTTPDKASGTSFAIKIVLTNSAGAAEKINTEANNKVFTVSYSAKLNDSAVIGGAGNTNKVYIKYSNNPNSTDEGKTPEDTTTVFTFQLKVAKVDGDGNPLSGAKFTLYKLIATSAVDVSGSGVVATGNWQSVAEVAVGDDGSADVYTKTADVALDAGKTYYTKSGATYTSVSSPDVANIGTYYEKTTGTAQKATFARIDDGIYKIVETQTPDGYNTVDPVYFEAVAEHQETENVGSYTLTTYTGTATESGSTVTFTRGVASTNVTVKDNSTGLMETTIVNQSGVSLPSTGGIGTTIFYVAGFIMVLGASIILIARRRADAE